MVSTIDSVLVAFHKGDLAHGHPVLECKPSYVCMWQGGPIMSRAKSGPERSYLWRSTVSAEEFYDPSKRFSMGVNEGQALAITKRQVVTANGIGDKKIVHPSMTLWRYYQGSSLPEEFREVLQSPPSSMEMSFGGVTCLYSNSRRLGMLVSVSTTRVLAGPIADLFTATSGHNIPNSEVEQFIRETFS